MGRKLFVGGLAWATSDESLKKAFEKFGQIVSANVIMDRDTGRSRGFGFVVYSEDGHAQAALDAMQGADLDGRRIRVDMATDGPGGAGGPRRDGRPGGDRPYREAPSYPAVERRGGGGAGGGGSYGGGSGHGGGGGYGGGGGHGGGGGFGVGGHGGYGGGGGDYPRRDWSSSPMGEPPPRWEGGEGEAGKDRATRRRIEKKRKELRGNDVEKDWPRSGRRFRKDDQSSWWDEEE